MSNSTVSADNEKRGKLLFLAGGIAIALFFFKITQADTQEYIWRIYATSGIYFLVAFVGLLFSFKFQVKKKSLLYLLQSSLFVFSEVLFIELFFFQKFSRIYEALILILLLILVFLGNYASFLMANVFNVNLYKTIPLVHVGRTASYVLSLLMMYFFIFSFLASGFPLYVLLPLVAVITLFIIFIHYLNIGLGQGELWRKTFLTFFIVFCLFLGSFLVGSSHEVVAIVPVVGFLISVSVVSQDVMNDEVRFGPFFYILIIVITFLINLFLNIF